MMLQSHSRAAPMLHGLVAKVLEAQSCRYLTGASGMHISLQYMPSGRPLVADTRGMPIKSAAEMPPVDGCFVVVIASCLHWMYMHIYRTLANLPAPCCLACERGRFFRG